MRTVSDSTQQAFIARDEYPYLLRYLKRRFGEVVRAGNDFWCTGGQVRVVASLAPGGQLLFPGENPFAPEVVALKEIIEKEKRYRIIKVPKVLHYCQTCLSFYVFSTAMNQHIGGGGEVHTITPRLEGSYTKYVPVLPPLEQRKGWIPREQLIKAFAKHVDPNTAEEMADLRIIASREGFGLSVQEMVQGTAKIPSIVSERYDAYRDELEAKMVPPVRVKKSLSPLSTPTTQALPTGKPQGFRTLLSSFLSWKVKVNGQVLSPERMIEVAVRLGLPTGLSNKAAILAARDVDEQIEDTGQLPNYTQVFDDAAKDEALADKLAAFMRRDKKLASAVRRARWDVARYKPSWKGRKGPVSPRYDEDQTDLRLSPIQPQPRQLEEDSEKEKQAFLARFNPEEIYSTPGGFIKAKTSFNSQTVYAFNTVFYPQRSLEPGEFPEERVSLAEEIAKATGGRVVVSTRRVEKYKDKKHNPGRAFLDVVVDGRYTVNVASRDLSIKLKKTTDPEQEKRDFMEKFSLKPADIIFEKEGLIKAAKTVTTAYGAWRVTVCNAVFTYRHIAPDEFPVHQTQIAQEIAASLGGSVAVAEDKKRGFKSLVVVVDGKYAVRVAKKPLSLS
jgi:hypothetical protein